MVFFTKFDDIRYIKELLVYFEYAAVGQRALHHAPLDFTDCGDIFIQGAVYYRKSASVGKYIIHNGEKFVHFRFVEVTDEEADNGAIEFPGVERMGEQICL